MASSLSGIASYQQTNQIWKNDQNTATKEKEGESNQPQTQQYLNGNLYQRTAPLSL